ncbi:alpha-glucosidase [Haloarculaceae archaeon H-GB2-1]|nr:alpha-glucosidase [Haloarculaceae archaeon H-GB1-1]MEA5386557.1 alpha-glucosidase [Haloarculaceae archaeon H-GB11]MEA5408069.1 alpha-glucosidase [Haloarculaceae archaeon H-GB2-1]
MTDENAWWKEAVVYQIYPKSFNDTDGDGVGDIQGIVEKLDYLDDLGVDVVWLNPVYESPQEDDGYDVSDYRAIDDRFGSMEDWERLRDGLHERDIRLIMDLVVNHTSDQHAWFTASREDPDGEYGDYYMWMPGEPDDLPNNWGSCFGGPAWRYDREREEWYLHLFDPTQPDLNWRNPDVRDEVAELVDWWLQQGIDGFRMDVINFISKPEGLPDGDPDQDWVGLDHFANGPHVTEYLQELSERTFDQYDAMAVGETPNVSVEDAREYTGDDGPLDMLFHFEHVRLDFVEKDWWDVGDWHVRELKEVFSRWQEGLADEGWNALYLDNHDQPRSVSRFGDDEQYRYESATALGTMLLTLRGTPFLYQGQELGMTNYPFDSLDEIRDADARNRVLGALDAGKIDSFESVKDVVRYRCRDNARTPMQWDDSENAGFTDGSPWLPVNPNYETVNAAAERARDRSIWTYHRDCIALRDDHDVLVYGDFDHLVPDHEQVFAYVRADDSERVLVTLNLTAQDALVELPVSGAVEQLLGNYDRDETDLASLTLRPYEAQIYRLS